MEKNDNKEDKLMKLIREFTKDQKGETIQKRLEILVIMLKKNHLAKYY